MTDTITIQPKKGMRFYHSRVLNEKRKSPQLYEITKILHDVVYYHAVYDGNVLGRSTECCDKVGFPKLVLYCEGQRT